MCGITGIYYFNEVFEKNQSQIDASVARLNLRGPNSSGVYSKGKISMGHARLSIIDLSDKASQPFSDNSGRYTIIFNGEFFNYAEHRKILENMGFHFRSDSDTEVLLYMFMNEGIDCLSKVNGFFAFAIYDSDEDVLHIARDRFGIKPLYYYFDENILVFASEMKALLQYNLKKNINFVSLYTFLQLNYIPAPNTIFEGIHKLEPAHFLSIRDGKTSKQKFYDIPYSNNNLLKSSDYSETCKKLEILLDDAVQMRLISDVPLGAFLSGGIDSSIIVALASRHTKHLNTFSIGFKDEPLFDETYFAGLVSKKFKTEHTVFKLTNNDLLEHLFNVLDYTDEPFADSSALAVYILSKQTKKHVTVALSGDGADELFAGYNKHFAEYRYQNNPLLMKLLGKTAPLLKNLPQSRNSSMLNKLRQIYRFTSGANLYNKERYWHWCGFANENEANNLILNPLNIEAYLHFKEKLLKHIPNKNCTLNDVLLNDVNLILPGDMLTKVDMMSMANSLEVRVPFLDYRIVNLAFQMPDAFKINKKGRKLILKDAFKKDLPPEIFSRKKHGFEVPLLKWFNNELKSLINNDLLEDNFIKEQGIFNVNELKKIKKQLFSSNPQDATARVWGLIVFQYWWKKYFN